MKAEQVLLEIARRDLQASESLLEKKAYAQSVFLLEQSVEKAVKSFAIRDHIIIEDESKGYVQHQLLMIYRIVLDKSQRDPQIFEQVLPEYSEVGNYSPDSSENPIENPLRLSEPNQQPFSGCIFLMGFSTSGVALLTIITLYQVCDCLS